MPETIRSKSAISAAGLVLAVGKQGVYVDVWRVEGRIAHVHFRGSGIRCDSLLIGRKQAGKSNDAHCRYFNGYYF